MITADPTLLFRGGGNRIRSISTMIRLTGKNYLRELIIELLALIPIDRTYEIDRAIVSSDTEFETNTSNIKACSLVILNHIQESLTKLPK